MLSPGELAVLQPGPELPAENIGKMPAAIQALMVAWYQVSPRPPPHELFTTSGAIDGVGVPLASVGAAIHWPAASRWALEQEVLAQPLAAIHWAPGATPIWLVPPSSPTMVPMVWVPWPLLSHGDAPHTPVGSNQLNTWLPVVVPRYLLTSAGWLNCTPVSMLATTTPWPVTPKLLH